MTVDRYAAAPSHPLVRILLPYGTYQMELLHQAADLFQVHPDGRTHVQQPQVDLLGAAFTHAQYPLRDTCAIQHISDTDSAFAGSLKQEWMIS